MNFSDKAGNEQFGWALLRTRDVDVLDDWDVSGLRGTGSNSLIVPEGTEIADAHFLPFRDLASGVRDKLRMRSSAAGGWATMGAVPLGVLDGATEFFLEAAATRPIAQTNYEVQLEAPQTHLILAEVYLKTEGHRLAAERNARATDERLAKGDFVLYGSAERAIRDRLDVAAAVAGCCESLELLLRNSGTDAVRLEHPLNRAVRDCRVIAMQGSCKLEPLKEEYGRWQRPGRRRS